MAVQFIGLVGFNGRSEIHGPGNWQELDVDYIGAAARAHEDAGFDRVLIAFDSSSPDSIVVTAHLAAVTTRLGFMLAHRPGFTQPTVAARQFATLDRLSNGRVAPHIITGGSDTALAMDGDRLTKDQRYRRCEEYLDIMRLEWSSTEPFDYEGEYYRVESAFNRIRPANIPIFFGGASDAAIEVASKHADIYATWGEPKAQIRELVAVVRRAAAKHKRRLSFSMSLRPVIADTEEAAWRRADEIIERVREVREATGLKTSDHAPPNRGSQRLLEVASRGERLDTRLWTALAAVGGAPGNSTGLVGTPEQVAEEMLDYWNIGIDHFLIRGFEPIDDAIAYGRDLIPLVRDLVARRGAREGTRSQADAMEARSPSHDIERG